MAFFDNAGGRHGNACVILKLGGNRQAAVTQSDGGKARAHLTLTAGFSPGKSVCSGW